MAYRAHEFGWVSWLEKWERRGELAVTVAVTALITWLAAALPTEHVTRVDIWPPIVVLAVLLVLGFYVLAAVEVGWWLPGRRTAHGKALALAEWDMHAREFERRKGGTAESDALNRIADLLDEVSARLPGNDDPMRQGAQPPPADYSESRNG